MRSVIYRMRKTQEIEFYTNGYKNENADVINMKNIVINHNFKFFPKYLAHSLDKAWGTDSL